MISKLLRIISIALLIIPTIAVPSSDDARTTSQHKAWTRSFLYSTAGSLMGAWTAWCYLQQKQPVRGIDDATCSIYLGSTIAGFTVALTIERGTAKPVRPVRLNADELPRKTSREHKELSYKIPKEPEELAEVLSSNKFYSKKLKKWVVFNRWRITKI